MDGRTTHDQGHELARTLDASEGAARTVAQRAALSDARAWLRAHDAACIETQVAVTEIPAPTGDEGARAAWITAQFTLAGLVSVHADAAGNVIGTRAGTTGDAAVVVCAHLDTVFPREAITGVRRIGVRLEAPGIGDNGRGLAALLSLARVMRAVGIRTRRPIRFVATTGEEGRGDLRGARHHFGSGAPPFAVIALDGTGDERIVHRAVASRRLHISLRGPGGHSWSDFGTPNPIHALALAIADATAAPRPANPDATLSIGRIGGGVAVNAIPADAWVEADIRSVSSDAVRGVEEVLRRSIALAVARTNATMRPGTAPLGVEISVIGDRPGGENPPLAPILEVAWAATKLEGRTPVLATGSTDANVPLSLGIPAIAIGGGGRGGDVHSPAEWFENVDGWRGISRALTIVTTLAG